MRNANLVNYFPSVYELKGPGIWPFKLNTTEEHSMLKMQFIVYFRYVRERI